MLLAMRIPLSVLRSQSCRTGRGLAPTRSCVALISAAKPLCLAARP
ncbi:hypothetical protein ACFPRL_28980 [Pseudoclavibacter helvolus]